MRAIKLIIGSLFAIAIIGGCGFLTYFFVVTSFLPNWLSIFVAVICVIAALATFYLWITTSVSVLREDTKRQVYHRAPK